MNSKYALQAGAAGDSSAGTSADNSADTSAAVSRSTSAGASAGVLRKDLPVRDVWKPGTMVYPLPAVLISCADRAGRSNIMSAAWTGTVCSEPPMVYVSVRPERFSHHMIEESGEYVINLTTEALLRATDFCGVRSGACIDKWKECGLTPIPASRIKAPLIKESPVNIECTVTQILRLGSHDMFIARVEAVDVDPAYMDAKGRFDMDACRLIAYNHGAYQSLGDILGTFGYSVRKKK